MRAFRLLCILTSFAAALFLGVPCAWLGRILLFTPMAAGPTSHVHDPYIELAGVRLTGWYVYGAGVLLGVLSIALGAVGVVLTLSAKKNAEPSGAANGG